MADAVQALLEEMVPELQQFVENDILSKGEVRALVKKRTDFEYRLRRRAAEKRDFERYIEYEMTFERLLKSRRERQGVKKGKGTGKFSCVKHIHFIFDRAVKKFRGDIDLWLEWIAYAKSEMSSKVLSKIFARALQLHPRNAKLWVHAAAYEWDMGNVTASRTLLQRGIRLNSKAEELWREYFRMEVLFTARLAERRRVLGLGKSAKKVADAEADGESAIAIGDLDEEGKGDGEDAVALPETQSVEEGLEELLAGSIPKAVVRYARETMQACPQLFFDMYDLCYLAGEAARSKLEEEILVIIDDIASSPAPPASSVASSQFAVSASADATAAAVTGSATRRAARAMAESAAAGGEEAAACDAAQEVLDKYLEPYRASGSALSPQKNAKGPKGGKVAKSANAEANPGACGAGAEASGNKMLAAAMWQAVCGFWTEVEAQAKGKLAAGKTKGSGAAAAVGRNPELAKEAGERASDMLDAARQQGVWTEEIALESIRRTLYATAKPAAAASNKGSGKGGKRARDARAGDDEDCEAKALATAKLALEQLPGNVNVATEYLRLNAKALMSSQNEDDALDALGASMDAVLKTCGSAPGAHKLWADRVQLQVARGSDAEPLVGILVCASNACTPEDGAQVLLAGLAAVDDALGHQLLLRIGNALLLRPLPALVCV